jgi:hypothetical protein
VLKLIGSSLAVLDEMDAERFELVLGPAKAADVRATALRLNPPGLVSNSMEV